MEILYMNGIPVLTYSDDLDDTIDAVLTLNDKEFLQISFWPASDEDFAMMAMLMVASLQPVR